MTTYITTAAAALAKNDFKEKTTAELVKTALAKIQSIIKITKHVGGKDKTEIKARVYDYPNKVIEIINDNETGLKVSKEEYDSFLGCPQNLLNKLADTIEDDMVFKVGIVEGNEVIEEKITAKDKELFVLNENEEEILFPELRDGDHVELQGKVTKGNERTNSIGLEYKGHILNCRPEAGGVKQYKQDLFNKAIISGIIHRVKGEPKPQLIIKSIKNLDSELGDQIPTLF